MSRTFSHSHINSFRRPIVWQHTKGFNQLKWKPGNFLLFPFATLVWFDCGFRLDKPYPASLHGMCAWSTGLNKALSSGFIFVVVCHILIWVFHGYTKEGSSCSVKRGKSKWELGFSSWQSTYWVIRLGYGLCPWGSRGWVLRVIGRNWLQARPPSTSWSAQM